MRLNFALVLFVCVLSLPHAGSAGPPSVFVTVSSRTVRAAPPDCDAPYDEAECAPTSPLIKVAAAAEGFGTQELTHKYVVNGGKVVGRGPNVTWDLADVLPGFYEIRVEVEDGRGERAAGSKRVTVERCSCPQVPPPTSGRAF